MLGVVLKLNTTLLFIKHLCHCRIWSWTQLWEQWEKKRKQKTKNQGNCNWSSGSGQPELWVAEHWLNYDACMERDRLKEDLSFGLRNLDLCIRKGDVSLWVIFEGGLSASKVSSPQTGWQWHSLGEWKGCWVVFGFLASSRSHFYLLGLSLFSPSSALQSGSYLTLLTVPSLSSSSGPWVGAL